MVHDAERPNLQTQTVDLLAGTGRTPAPVEDKAPHAIESATLLQGGRSVTICHNGERYRLQATRQGKLILTK
jgi:hemin uptake protein HemP